MRLNDLPRTSGFRLGLLFLGLFGAASMLLFGFLYWQTVGYMHKGIDEWLTRIVVSLVEDSQSEMKERIAGHAQRDPEGRYPFGLFDSQGHHLLGPLSDLPASAPADDKPFDFTLPQGGELTPFRGIAHRLPSGDIVLVAENVRMMHRFHGLLIDAMTSGIFLVIAIGFAGAVATGIGSIRQFEAVTGAIDRIVKGNLSERLPTKGKDSDLDRLVHFVNAMLDDLERLMHEVKGVTDAIAHDLRTPLTRLLAGLERAKRRAASAEEYTDAVDEAITETKGILATFAAMLRISEIESGARRAGFEAVDLATIAGDVVDFYAPLAEAKGVELRLESATPAQLSGDSSLLFEAISNLVNNALKFTPACGTVVVRVFAGKERLGVTVADDGPGMGKTVRGNEMPHCLGRGRKIRTAHGNGLGLKIVAAVARLHGMDMTVEDTRPGCSLSLIKEAPALVGQD